ncbi:MAG: hypothetical protein CMJ18_12070 [Phycisphaeraceae bacterium]|nr:hypothetical protein [Phycisphaeraceae bacterium]
MALAGRHRRRPAAPTSDSDGAIRTEFYNGSDSSIHLRLAAFPSGSDVVVANSYDSYTEGRNLGADESRKPFCIVKGSRDPAQE